jgi:hypothetical protein
LSPFTDPYSGITTSVSAFLGNGANNGGGCIGWHRRKADCNIGTDPDMQFSLLGSKITFTSFVDLPLVRK